MADTSPEIVHQHYTNAAAAIAAMNDKNWAFEQAGDRLIVMDGATPRYYDTTAAILASGSFILNQTASPQTAGFNVSGNGIVGGTFTVAGVADFATTVSIVGVLTTTAGVVVGSGLTVGTSITVSGLSSGRIPVVSTAGLITQGHFYADNVNARLGIGSGASAPGFDLDVSKSSVGGTVQFGLSNTDNTNTASHARMQITGGGASGGDAALLFTLAGVGSNWAMGLDNSDADAFVISENSSLGTSNALRIASGGAVTIPGTLGVTGTTALGALTATTANFSSTITTPLTASLPVFTNGSSQLTTNAMTGTGSVMMSASPTTTGTMTGAAANFSGAVSTGALTATTGTFALTDNISNAFRAYQGSTDYIIVYTNNGGEIAAFGSDIATCSTTIVGGFQVNLSSDNDILLSGYATFAESVRLDGFVSAGALSTSAGSPTALTTTAHNSYTFTNNMGTASYCTLSGPDSGRLMAVKNRTSQQLYITNGPSSTNPIASGYNAILIGNGSTWDVFSMAI